MFVIVSTIAMTVELSANHRTVSLCAALTNECQPDELEPHYSNDRESYPERRLTIERQPEEPLVCCIHELSAWLIRLRCALKDPVTVA